MYAIGAFLIRTPPKSWNATNNILADVLREFETGHSVDRNSLENWFNEDLFLTRAQQIVFPVWSLLFDSIGNEPKNSPFGSPNSERETQVFRLLVFCDSSQLQEDSSANRRNGIFAEVHGWFFKVDLLSRYWAIDMQNLLNSADLLDVSFAKEKWIICKKIDGWW